MNIFTEGKQKVKGLTKLQELRNALKEIEKPVPAPTDSVNAAFNHYYVYFQEIANILGNFFAEGDAAKLLKTAGVSKEIVDDFLSFWARLAGKSQSAVLGKMRYGYDPDQQPTLADIQRVATGTPIGVISTLEAMLNIICHTKDVSELITSICDKFTDSAYKVCKDTEKSLTSYLKNEKALKTSIMDYLRKDRSFEK